MAFQLSGSWWPYLQGSSLPTYTRCTRLRQRACIARFGTVLPSFGFRGTHRKEHELHSISIPQDRPLLSRERADLALRDLSVLGDDQQMLAHLGDHPRRPPQPLARVLVAEFGVAPLRDVLVLELAERLGEHLVL